MPGYWLGLTSLFFCLVFLCQAFQWEKVVGLQPQSSKGSENETTPDETDCLLGQVWSDKDEKCVPLCISGCENGFCEETNKCSCKAPLILKHNNTCVEKPLNSNCGDTLESCQCKAGFRMNNETCAPVCSSVCLNGYCVSPDECACNKGYVNNSTNPNICYKAPKDLIPKCNLGGECFCYCDLDGATHRLMKSPKAKDFNFLSPCPKDICEPKCTHECVNGTCVGLDVCKCEPPLQLKDKRICVEPELKTKVYDCIWWLVCCASALIVTAISFLCCMYRRKKYTK